MNLQGQVAAILREGGLLPPVADDPPVSVEESLGGAVVIRRHPGGTANVGFVVGDVLARIARLLSEHGLQVTEEPGEGDAPPYLKVWPAP